MGIVCDTQAQVERFVMEFAGDAQSAIDNVKPEAPNSTACTLADVAYVPGSRIEMVRHGGSGFEIVRISTCGLFLAIRYQGIRSLDRPNVAGE